MTAKTMSQQLYTAAKGADMKITCRTFADGSAIVVSEANGDEAGAQDAQGALPDDPGNGSRRNQRRLDD